MYKILIVDDEAIEREVLSFLLQQHNFPLQISEAANGREALTLLQEQQFDILLTDVCMPYINGIYLANQARELYPDIQIIFFSGYNDFSYVKEALPLRAINYILKPINPEEFSGSISNAIMSLQAQENCALESETMIYQLQNHILYQLVNGICIKQLQNNYPNFDFSFTYTFNRLFLIQFEDDYFSNEPETINDLFSRYAPDLILTQHYYFINLNDSQNLVLFSYAEQPESWYQDLANLLIDQIRNIYNINCHIVISKPFWGPDEIHPAYTESEYLLSKNFFVTEAVLSEQLLSSGQDEVLQYSTISSLKSSPNDNDIIKQLQLDIQLADTTNLKTHMDMFFNNWKNKEKISLLYFRYMSINILELFLDSLNIKSEENFETYANIILNAHHVSHVENLLSQIMEKLIVFLENSNHSPHYALQQVIHYINTHYGEDLNLDLLASKVYLTPRYLSSLFIKELGYGINKYIKKVRMEHAQQLLLTTNLKINNICHKVGYTNLSYFCKSFAEHFGITPEKYRIQNSFQHELSVHTIDH